MARGTLSYKMKLLRFGIEWPHIQKFM